MEIREVIESELRNTKRKGTDCLISGLQESGFLDEACSDGHDTGRGGLANHTLWVLRLARRELKWILEKHPELPVPEESVTMLCLMYGFTKSAKSVPELSEITLTADEKTALDNVGYRAVAKKAEPSLPDSESPAALLHYILRESVRLAVEYADGIPFCVKAEDAVRPELINDEVTACFEYRNCVFIISRFPHYRSSYIIAQRIDGKWGAFSIKRELSQDKVPAVRMTGVLHFDYRSFDEALDKLCQNGGRRTFLIRVTDPEFYYRFSVTDILRH